MATVLLLVQIRVVGHVADAAARAALSSGDVVGMRVELLADAAAALFVLVVAVTLSVYKPKGVTRYGWCRQHGSRAPQRPAVREDPAAV
ncbi:MULTISPECIES: hypothetical protein [Streptomyces]|uniref:Uncharacterized protein n=1 Tax=Streptomyces zinciresistens K42 TaxID=700597 RepID=G2G5W3_9ACTN|nr:MULTISPECIES: hypothetical protein [Streptomyces]EGX61052.1 hypothetical protein SZN_04336 [Streptomyces zinciresistens K42]MDT9696576.1 hypothetical protein [Streptomyces sp. P17]